MLLLVSSEFLPDSMSLYSQGTNRIKQLPNLHRFKMNGHLCASGQIISCCEYSSPWSSLTLFIGYPGRRIYPAGSSFKFARPSNQVLYSEAEFC